MPHTEDEKTAPERLPSDEGAEQAAPVGLALFRKYSLVLVWLLALFPLLQVLALYGYACQACWYLGHWPSYNNPDPKTLGWWLQHDVLTLGFMATPVFPIFAMLLAIAARKKLGHVRLWIIMTMAVLSTAACIIHSRVDPFGITEWFFD